MTEFECAACGIAVTIFGRDDPPADGLCTECRVIAEAAPEDRAQLARIFERDISVEPRAVYARMTTPELLEIRRAFELDRAHARNEAARQFIDGRLGIIRELLSGRTVN